ncbi:hypothetical protein Plhal703r1_c07g0041551 [Plasmopara halstedii]
MPSMRRSISTILLTPVSPPRDSSNFSSTLAEGARTKIFVAFLFVIGLSSSSDGVNNGCAGKAVERVTNSAVVVNSMYTLGARMERLTNDYERF